jgi:hypothetical protein
VTLIVVASVGIVFDAGGEPRLMVANAANLTDNVSSLQLADQYHFDPTSRSISRRLAGPVGTTTWRVTSFPP